MTDRDLDRLSVLLARAAAFLAARPHTRDCSVRSVCDCPNCECDTHDGSECCSCDCELVADELTEAEAIIDEARARAAIEAVRQAAT